MFDRIVDFSLRNKGAVLFLTLVVAVTGYAAFRDLTIEAFPDPTAKEGDWSAVVECGWANSAMEAQARGQTSRFAGTA